MRRLICVTALAVLASAGAASASAPPDTAPDDTMVAGTAVGDSSATLDVPAATIYDDSGEPVATVTVTGTQTEWTEYAEGSEPDEGRSYVRLDVEVTSQVNDGSFDISVDQFILQDMNGVVTVAETVESAEQAESEEDIVDDAELANGETLALTLTFQVAADVGPQSVFYRPGDDRLVDIVELG
jgi:hypothetical protein